MRPPLAQSLNLVSIDPGRSCGWAVFHRDSPNLSWRLRFCGLATSTQTNLGGMVTEIATKVWSAVSAINYDQMPAVAVELMEHRPGDSRSIPDDLIKVASVAAGVAYAISREVSFHRPGDWKGSVPKEIMGRRMKLLLSIEELQIIQSARVAPSLEHNMLDAVGIGLWACGRMSTGGGY